MPRFTASARSRRCAWQGLRSLHVLRMATTGLLRNSSRRMPICWVRWRCAKPRMSSDANQRWLRSSSSARRAIRKILTLGCRQSEHGPGAMPSSRVYHVSGIDAQTGNAWPPCSILTALSSGASIRILPSTATVRTEIVSKAGRYEPLVSTDRTDRPCSGAAGSEAPAGARPASPSCRRHPRKDMPRRHPGGMPKTIISRCVSSAGRSDRSAVSPGSSRRTGRRPADGRGAPRR